VKRSEFRQLLHQEFARCESTLFKKSDEYASDSSALHNFNTAASLTGETPEQALGGMMVKHTVSIFDMIREGAESFTIEQWDEKIGDHVNYLMLLKAIVVEAHKDRTAPALFSTDAFLMNAPDTYNQL
jgi:hypothetical protein